MATTARTRPGKQQTPPARMEGVSALQLEQEGDTLLWGSSADGAAATAPHTEPLVLPSRAVFFALLLAPLALWFVAVGAGILSYQGLPSGSSRLQHALTWFDRGVLRPAGPLLPLAVLAARMSLHALIGRLAGGQTAPLRFGSLSFEALVMYGVITVARLLVYLVHYTALSKSYLDEHFLSDHIFLGASMLSCMQAELLCLASDIRRARNSTTHGSTTGAGPAALRLLLLPVALTGLALIAAVLYCLTVGDMYFTARYYHLPLESFTTLAAALLLFQLPVLVWLRMRHRVRLHHPLE